MLKLFKIIACFWMLIFCSCFFFTPEKESGGPKKEPPLLIEGKNNNIKIPEVPPEGWSFQRKAITFLVRASKDLNIFQDRSHTLMLGIYQISDPNGFNGMVETREGLQQLLGSNTLDPGSGIVAFEKQIISPKTEKIFILDRAKSAQYIGIVAGYYNLQGENIYRLIKIPAVQEIRQKTGMARFNPFSDSTESLPARPGKLKVLLELGSYQIKLIDTYAD